MPRITLQFTLAKETLPSSSFRLVYTSSRSGEGRIMAVSKMYITLRSGQKLEDVQPVWGGVKLFRRRDFDRTAKYWSTQRRIEQPRGLDDELGGYLAKRLRDESNSQLTDLVGMAWSELYA